MNASIESKGYVATDADVATLTNAVLSATQEGETGRRNYLRMLIATTQKELGAEPRSRAGKPQRLDAEGTEKQLKALETVHERFYAVVLKVVGDTLPGNMKDRGIEINRRSNFVRTALSAVRRWVRAGNDLTPLAAKSTTKASLAVEAPLRPPRPPSAKALKTRAERESKTFVATVMALADEDKGAAVAEMQLMIGQLAEQMAALGVMPTRDADQAAREHRPLRMKSTLFLPTASQVLQQQARPS